METPEIEAAVKNMEYYATKMLGLAKKQYNTWFEKYDVQHSGGMAIGHGLAEIGAASARIGYQCGVIRTNLQAIAETDLPLLKACNEEEGELE